MLFKKILITIIAIAVLSPCTVNAAMKEYIREYTHQVGDADSKVTSRQISTQEIKVELLGELGTYISSRMEMSQGNKTDAEFKEEVIALTAGYVRVDMIEERFNGETYYLKAKLSADPDDVISRINKETANRTIQYRDNLVKSYQDNKVLIAQLAALQKNLRLIKAESKEAETLLKEFAKNAKRLKAIEYFELGLDYWVGRKGVTKDHIQAFNWFTKSTDKGYAKGQLYLGYLYQNGYHSPSRNPDYNKTMTSFLKAAEQGSTQAYLDIGAMYEEGNGIAKNENQAKKWFLKAVEQGDYSGYQYLGAMYYFAGDLKQAVFWYLKAAEQGIADRESYIVIAIAAANGNKTAVQGLDAIAKKLSPLELKEAREDAALFYE